MRMYQATDAYLKKLKNLIRQNINHISVMSFDELNVIHVKKETTEMFDRFLEFNLQEYEKIAKQAYNYGVLLNSSSNNGDKIHSKSKKIDFASMVETVLASYNSVTGYLYEKEAERKRLRLMEEILSAREFIDRQRFQEALRKSANLWYTQSAQYSIDIEDYTVIQTFKEYGITKVRWIAEKDDKVCKKCRKLDGRVFDINKVPGKAHYNCRCTIRPYVGNDKK